MSPGRSSGVTGAPDTLTLISHPIAAFPTCRALVLTEPKPGTSGKLPESLNDIGALMAASEQERMLCPCGEAHKCESNHPGRRPGNLSLCPIPPFDSPRVHQRDHAPASGTFGCTVRTPIWEQPRCRLGLHELALRSLVLSGIFSVVPQPLHVSSTDSSSSYTQ
jgi:hypothetical protein